MNEMDDDITSCKAPQEAPKVEKTKPKTEGTKPKTSRTRKPTPKKEESIDLNQYVEVRNGYHGRLIYKSSHTGEIFDWKDFGDTQDMTVKELRNAKSSCKNMFINNYFIIDDKKILEYLGVSRYYNLGISIEEFDKLFDKTPEEISDIVKDLPAAQKRSVSYRARQLINEDVIDSRKMIKALSDILETDFE